MTTREIMELAQAAESLTMAIMEMRDVNKDSQEWEIRTKCKAAAQHITSVMQVMRIDFEK